MQRVLTNTAKALSLGLWALLLGLFITIVVSPILWALSLWLSGDSQSLPWSFGVMFSNYMAMLWYLVLPWRSTLEMPDFPSSQSALSHFAEVKQLFMIALIVFVILTPIIYVLVKHWRQRYVTMTTQYLLSSLMVAPIMIAILALFNFNTWFVAFHHLLFNNNDWLFNPVTDPIICILPEYFFALCALMIIGIDCLSIYLIKRWIVSYKG